MDEPTNSTTALVVNHSDQIGEIAKALAVAQGKFVSPERNRSVMVRSDKGNYTFKYATLDTILDMVRQPLSAAGIALVQGVQSNGDLVRVSTMLVHTSGQWIESSISFRTSGRPQETGSVITYARRYTLSGLLGIAAEEDDDANIAEGNTISPAGPQATIQTPQRKATAPGKTWGGKIKEITVKRGEKKNGETWEMFTVRGEDGTAHKTFSKRIADICKGFEGTGEEVVLGLAPDGLIMEVAAADQPPPEA